MKNFNTNKTIKTLIAAALVAFGGAQGSGNPLLLNTLFGPHIDASQQISSLQESNAELREELNALEEEALVNKSFVLGPKSLLSSAESKGDNDFYSSTPINDNHTDCSSDCKTRIAVLSGLSGLSVGGIVTCLAMEVLVYFKGAPNANEEYGALSRVDGDTSGTESA